MTDNVEVLPYDVHNQTLIGNVHPSDWTNPDPAGRYNLVVIGAGTAGLVAAAGAAGLGARVALVERHLMGGDCLNYGCVPSKGIISSGRVAAAVRDSGRFGVKVPDEWSVDFGAAMERMRRFLIRWRNLDPTLLDWHVRCSRILLAATDEAMPEKPMLDVPADEQEDEEESA